MQHAYQQVQVQVHGDDGLEIDDQLDDLADLDSGMSGSIGGKQELAGTGKYAAVYNDVNDPAFWNVLKEYVDINGLVCGYIHDLGSASATLSDAARALLLIDHHVRDITTTKYAALFGGSLSQFCVPVLQNLWATRMKAALTDHHVLALLLDMRPSTRQFVAENRLLGTEGESNVGNTPTLERARRSLLELAQVCVPDKLLPGNTPADKRLAMKQHILRQQFDVLLEVHPQHIPLGTLKISADAIKRVTDADAPLCFWQTDVPPDLPLRNVGLRTQPGKPTGTGTERIWNYFGQVFTPGRRSMRSNRVAQLVYVKTNLHLLGNDASLIGEGLGQLTDPSQFRSVFEEAAQLDDEDFVRSITQAVEVHNAPSAKAIDIAVLAEPHAEEEHDWLAGFA